jgi:hypothetical protein
VKRAIPGTTAHVQVRGSNMSEYVPNGYEATGAIQTHEEPFHVSSFIFWHCLKFWRLCNIEWDMIGCYESEDYGGGGHSYFNALF